MRYLWLFLISSVCSAQGLPNGGVSQGQIWTPAQWNAAWSSKLDTYSQSAAELAAGVTPSNRGYPVGNLLRYGANCTGSSNDTAAINSWLAVVEQGVRGLLPTGTCVYNGQLSINLSGATTGILIEGQGVKGSILKVVTSSSPAVSITGGTSALFYTRLQNFNLITALDGIGLQACLPTFADACNGFIFENLVVNNTNNTSNAIAAQLNGVFNGWFNMTANCGGTTCIAALELNRTQMSNFYGSYSTANVGVYLTGSQNSGNVFHAIDVEVVNYGVKLDSSNDVNNTFEGGQWVWNIFGVTATAGSRNLFLNAHLGSTPTGFYDPSNSVGVINFTPNFISVTYSASIATNWALGNVFQTNATDSTPFTIAAPSNPTSGQCATYQIINTSGGALGTVTWSGFKLATWTSPATGNNRSITFCDFNGVLYEVSRDTTDIPN